MNAKKILLVILLGFMMGYCIYHILLIKFLPSSIALFGTLSLAIPSIIYLIFVHQTQSFTQKLSPFLGIFFIFFSTSIFYLLIFDLLFFGYFLKYQSSIALFCSILAILLCIFALYTNTHKPRIQQLSFTLPLGAPLRAIQISDLHLGGAFLKLSFLQDLIQTINHHQPDIIFLTGDIIDAPPHTILKELEILEKLKAKIGIYYVLGNHEYFYDLDQILQTIQSLGFTPLTNQSTIITQNNQPILNISGINDLSGHNSYQANLQIALKDINPNLPTILLSHQPGIIRSLQPQSVFLVLSGHTHGGQIFPFNWLVLLQQPFIKGLHKHQGIWVYVSEGTGFWGIPMRLGSKSEITIIDLLPII